MYNYEEYYYDEEYYQAYENECAIRKRLLAGITENVNKIKKIIDGWTPERFPEFYGGENSKVKSRPEASFTAEETSVHEVGDNVILDLPIEEVKFDSFDVLPNEKSNLISFQEEEPQVLFDQSSLEPNQFHAEISKELFQEQPLMNYQSPLDYYVDEFLYGDRDLSTKIPALFLILGDEIDSSKSKFNILVLSKLIGWVQRSGNKNKERNMVLGW